LPWEPRIDAIGIAVPEIHGDVLEWRASLVLHLHDDAQRFARLPFGDVATKHVEVEVVRAFGLLRVDGAQIAAV
jgi:hypothetical protein